ncbi:MAG: hypothetical protein QOF29_116 [bacterium]
MTMSSLLANANVLHNGSLWLILACFGVFVGVVAGLFTRLGSEITAHPYSKPDGSGELGSDMPPESIGREEIEPLLEPRRAGRRRRRR